VHELSKKLLSGLNVGHVGHGQLPASFLGIANPARTLRADHGHLRIILVELWFLSGLGQPRDEFFVGEVERQNIEHAEIVELGPCLPEESLQPLENLQVAEMAASVPQMLRQAGERLRTNPDFYFVKIELKKFVYGMLLDQYCFGRSHATRTCQTVSQGYGADFLCAC
jgi:hypothetical protein